MNNKLYKLVLSAMFAALICVTTMVIQIPSPMNGYVNLGDCFVLVSGMVLGPLYSFFAAAIGSGLADILSGYAYYAPATFFIKGIMSLIFSIIVSKAFRNRKKFNIPALLTGSLVSEIIMVIGYFLFACVFLGKGIAAATSIPGNIMQGVFGIISSTLLLKLIIKNLTLKKLLHLEE